MTRNVFTVKNLVFSAEAFLADMGREPVDNDWIYRVDGRPIVESRTSPPGGGNGDNITVGRIKGTHFWVYPEWCKKEGERDGHE